MDARDLWDCGLGIKLTFWSSSTTVILHNRAVCVCVCVVYVCVYVCVCVCVCVRACVHVCGMYMRARVWYVRGEGGGGITSYSLLFIPAAILYIIIQYID